MKCHTHGFRTEDQKRVVSLGTNFFVDGGIPERLCKTKQDSAGYVWAGREPQEFLSINLFARPVAGGVTHLKWTLCYL